MFYEQLEKICKIHGVKPTTVTVELGFSKGTMSNWKKGATPNGDAVVRFAEHFNVSTDYFLLGDSTLGNSKNYEDDIIEYDLTKLTDYEKQIIYKCRSGAKIIFDDDLTSEAGLINGLNRKESNIILKYRALDERNKEELEDILNLKYDRVLNQHVVNENKDTSSTLINGKENMVG